MIARGGCYHENSIDDSLLPMKVGYVKVSSVFVDLAFGEQVAHVAQG